MRKIISITFISELLNIPQSTDKLLGYLVAICDDGSIWKKDVYDGLVMNVWTNTNSDLIPTERIQD